MAVDDRDPLARIRRAQQKQGQASEGFRPAEPSGERDPMERIRRATTSSNDPSSAVADSSVPGGVPSVPAELGDPSGFIEQLEAAESPYAPGEAPEVPAPRQEVPIGQKLRTLAGAPVRGAANAAAGIVQGLDVAPPLAETRGLPLDAQETVERGRREIHTDRLERSMAGETLPAQIAAAVRAEAERRFPGDPETRETFVNGVLEGLGSVVPFLAAGFASGPASLPVMAGMGMSAAGGQTLQDAAANEATGEQAREAAAIATPAGAAEAIPLERALGRLVPQPLKRRAIEVALGGIEEFSQEAFNAVSQNLAAKLSYDPDRDLMEGVREDAETGGAVGLLVSTIATALGARGVRRPGSPRGTRGDVSAETLDEGPPPAESQAGTDERDPLERLRAAGIEVEPSVPESEQAVEQEEAAPPPAPVLPEPEAEAEPVAPPPAQPGAPQQAEAADELGEPVNLRINEREGTAAVTIGTVTDEVTGEGEVARVVADVREGTGDEPGAIRVKNASVVEERRGEGFGTQAYTRLLEAAQERGLALESDVEVTPAAARVWESLERRGHAVERNPTARLEEVGGVEKWVTDSGPVFRIAPEAAAPEAAAPGAEAVANPDPNAPPRLNVTTVPRGNQLVIDDATEQEPSPQQSARRARTTAADYGAELVDYGGIPTPRSEVIADLQAQGLSEQQINRYMQGLEAGRRRRSVPASPEPVDSAMPAEPRPVPDNYEATLDEVREVFPQWTADELAALDPQDRADVSRGVWEARERRRVRDAQPAGVPEAAPERDGGSPTPEPIAQAQTGQPLRVRLYHGTPETFGAFEDRPGRFDAGSFPEPNTQLGATFTPDRRDASTYGGPEGTTMEVDVALENPFVAQTYAELEAEAGRIAGKPTRTSAEIRAALEGAGYDGVVVREGGLDASANPLPWVHTFRPSQQATVAQPAASPEAQQDAPEAPPRLNVTTVPRGNQLVTDEDAGSGQQGQPPAESAPAPDGGPSEETVALNKAAITDARALLGLDALEPAAARRWDRVLTEAVEQGIPQQADAIAAAVLSGQQKAMTDAEHAGLVLAAAQKQKAHAQAIAEADAALESGDQARSEHLRERADALLASLDAITEASDKAGREVARALSIRRLRLNAETYELAPVIRQARVEAQRDLTPEERSKLEGLVKQVQAYETRVKALESRIERREQQKARQAAQKVVEREVDKRRRAESQARESEAKRAARDVERQKVQAEREDIKRDLRALGLRVNDVTGLTAEGSILVGRLALNYAKEGVLTIQDVVARVQQDLPDLTEAEILRALAAPKRQTKDRTAEELDRLRVERRRAQKAVRAAQRALRPRTRTAWIGEVVGLPRSLMATGDWSATLRQGAILMTRFPVRGARNFGRAAKAFFSEFEAERIDLMIREDPRHFEREASGLYIAPLGDEAAIATVTAREETFMSRIIEGVPGLGQLMKASERHYVTFLNLMRASAFDYFLDAYPQASREQLRAWADYVNVASGRGDLGQFNAAASGLSAVFFAPRYMVSRFQVGTKAVRYAGVADVNKEIGKTLAAFVGTGMAALALAALALDDEEGYVGTDPDDADFGKIVVGNTRIDLWAGESQVARLLARQALIARDGATYGRGPFDIAAQFLKYKLAPPPAIVMELQTGKNAIGEETTPAQTALRSVLPLNVTQAIEAGQAGGADAAAAVFAGQWFGLGVDVYDDPLSGASVKTLLMRADYRPPPGPNADPEAFADEFARRVDAQRARLRNLPPERLKEELQEIARTARRSAR